MNRLKSYYLAAIVLLSALIVGCAGNGEAFQKQLDEDAKAYTEMKCELIKQLRAIEADTTIANQQEIGDSLRTIWKEQASKIQEKYNTPEHKDMFKEKVKEYQLQIEGCEPFEDEGVKMEKRKEKKEKREVKTEN